MAVLNEQTLKEQIKSGELGGLYLIYGEEDYLKKYYVGQMAIKSVGKDFESFNLHRFEGRDTEIDEIAQSVEAVPMMSEKSCVVVRDMELDSLKSSETDKLKELLSDLPEYCVLIFWQDSVEVNVRQNAKWRGVINLFESHGNVVELGRRDISSIMRLLSSGAQKRGCTIGRDAAMYMVSSVGDDLNILLNELEKACSFAGSGEITKEIIDKTAVKSLEATAFDLVKALVSGSYERGLMLLEWLFAQKTEPLLIMGALISAYVDMYRAKVAVAGGEKAEIIAKSFNYKNKEFRLRNAARDASKLSINQLRASIDELAKADEQLKSSKTDKRTILEELMIKLVMISNTDY